MIHLLPFSPSSPCSPTALDRGCSNQDDGAEFGDEVKGNFERQPIRPAFYERATYYGLQDAAMEAMS